MTAGINSPWRTVAIGEMFCDISLDYIKFTNPLQPPLIVIEWRNDSSNRRERISFVDEAAPPALMRALALEILRRKLAVTWWTNISIRKSFTKDLCLLLKAQLYAVSGGLEAGFWIDY
jgi:hypothetical protein